MNGSNVIVTSGGLGHPIVAGTPLTNGPTFPIKYFLLAYDPSIDPDIHTQGTITSAVPFVSAAQSGDSSLIQRGGHYIFKDPDKYEISTQQFLILSGAEGPYAPNTISGSDKSHSTTVTLYDGKPLLNVISGTSPTDLYAVEPLGTWHSSQSVANKIVADTSTDSFSADSDKYFEIAGYSPILTSAGAGTEGLLRGVYKCRVGSEYGNFKFNKIGLYMESVGNPPVLIAVALLNTAIAKNKTGSSITSVEFDIEIQFHTEGTFDSVVYKTNDYWYKIPDLSGYGLYTDHDVAIGTSGTGWLPKAKLELTTMGEKPALCLNRNYNENYMFVDVLSNASVLGTALSASTYMKIYGTDVNSIMFNKANPVSYFTDSGSEKIKHGVYVYDSSSSSNYNVNGFCTRLMNLQNVKDVKGFYSSIYNHYGLSSRTTYGFYSKIDTFANDNQNCDKYGFYSKVEGQGKRLYGIYAEVAPTTIAGTAYGAYFKCPESFGYAVYADGSSYLNGETIMNGSVNIYGETTINGGSTTMNGNAYILGNIVIDGSTTMNGTLTVNASTTFGDIVNINDMVNISGATTISGFTKLGDNATGLKCKILDLTSPSTSATTNLSYSGIWSDFPGIDKIVSFKAILFNELNRGIIESGTTINIGGSNNDFTVVFWNTYLNIYVNPLATWILNRPVRVLVWYKE